MSNAGHSPTSGPGDDPRAVSLRQRLLAAQPEPARLQRRTNTQSNTAFRGFGGPQGAIAIEMILTDWRAAWARPAGRARRNFYAHRQDNVTPHGQAVEDNIIAPAASWWQQRLRRAARRPSRPSMRQPGAQARTASRR